MQQNKNKAKTTAAKIQDTEIFALDIGTRTVVGIYGEQVDETFVLKDHIVIPHSKRAMIDGQIEDIKQVAKVVSAVKEQIEERNNIVLTNASIAAAGRALKTITITKDFDTSDSDGITEAMIKSMEIETVQQAQKEIDEKHSAPGAYFHCVGYSVIKYELDDYKIMNLEGHKGDKATITLIATFLPSVVVEGLNSVVDMSGLEVGSLTLEPIAAMNLIIPQEIRLINIALVDIGAGTSDIAISKDGSIVAYAMATLAGDEITEEIIKTFFVDFATAEQMKHDSTTGEKEITYRDIFGISQKIKVADFYKKLDGAIEKLAEVIAENITEVNGGSPAAVFLVGGGSLITGLGDKVAKLLQLDKSRVAIGSKDNYRNVDLSTTDLGAEFATPIGIAVTRILNMGYDFSLIEINDRKLRIFDTKAITLFDLLTMSGYKSHEIMGRSGRSLTFSLGGRHRKIGGGPLTPAVLMVNGELASLESKVLPGCHVDFTPAVCGENATATLRDVYDFENSYDGNVTFAGQTYKIGATFFVDGKQVYEDYQIKSLDHIETAGILTLGDLLESLEIDPYSQNFTVNGDIEPPTFILQDGDIVDYEIGLDKLFKKSERAERSFEPTPIPFTDLTQNPLPLIQPDEPVGDIKITLNGEEVTIAETPSKSPHTFIEVLNFIEYDSSNSTTPYTMLLNGKEAGFTERINDGDVIVIEAMTK